jgi:hypothetical protein
MRLALDAQRQVDKQMPTQHRLTLCPKIRAKVPKFVAVAPQEAPITLILDGIICS